MFDIPADWISTNVDVAIKANVQGGFLTMTGRLKADMPGAILLEARNADGGYRDILMPKANVNHITKASTVVTATVVPRVSLS